MLELTNELQIPHSEPRQLSKIVKNFFRNLYPAHPEYEGPLKHVIMVEPCGGILFTGIRDSKKYP